MEVAALEVGIVNVSVEFGVDVDASSDGEVDV